MEPVTSAAVYEQITLPVLSLGEVALILLVILPGAAVIGYATGLMSRRQSVAQGKEVDSRVGETTVGAILAIFGLLLAFSFGNALSLNQSTKTTLINEAAALGTVFARADYLPEPGRTKLKQAILDYTETRLLPGDGTITTVEQAQTFLETSLRAQSKLWPLTLEHTADSVPPPIKTFFASAMNDALDAHLHRMRTLSEPISVVSQFMVFGAALVALFLVGNRVGTMGRVLTWRIFMLSGFIWIVLMTIVDVERAVEGFIQVDDATLRATIADMKFSLR